jgi:glycosyltransferase involved in cell wall biosynthesis
MRVSVVIPALNEEAVIETCLKSIRAQNTPCELIVIDNGSTDRTIEIAKEFCDKVFCKPEMTLAQIRDFGVEVSSGDIIVTTDADCVAPPHWLKELTKPFKNPKVVAVGGPFRPINPSILASFFCFLSAKTQLIGLFGGANMAYKRSAFNNTLGYENANRAEDWKLSWNLRKTGKTVHASRAYIRTEIPFNRQLEYPALILSLLLLLIGINSDWYMITGFAIGYLGSIGTTFIYRYRKSIILTFFAFMALAGFIMFRGLLDKVNTLYIYGGIIGILVYLFGIEYLRMGLEFIERLRSKENRNLNIVDVLKKEISKNVKM